MKIFIVERWIDRVNRDHSSIGFEFMYAFKNEHDAIAYAERWIKNVLIDPVIEHTSDADADYILCQKPDVKYLFRIKESELIESFN